VRDQHITATASGDA